MSEIIEQCVSQGNPSVSPHTPRSGATLKDQLEKVFHHAWNVVADKYSKLQFYRQLKKSPGFEAYLSIPNRDSRKAMARFRSSSHRLNVETARYHYTSQRISKTKCNVDDSIWRKSCKNCCEEIVAGIQQLPFADEPTIEDERHVLVACPVYHHLRLSLSDHVLSALLAWDERLQSLFEAPYIDELATFVLKIFSIRFPKSTKDVSPSSNDNTRTAITIPST